MGEGGYKCGGSVGSEVEVGAESVPCSKSIEYSVLKPKLVVHFKFLLPLCHETRVQVVRMHGDMQSTLRVQFTCKDDTAVAGLDYVMTEVSCAGCHPDGACAC